MQKILFLDFDGVLHPASPTPNNIFGKAKELGELLSLFPCNIVISSSWRFHFPFAELVQRFPENIRHLIVGQTGEPHIGKWPRFNEIKDYMIQKRLVADWRALDDSYFEFPNYCEELILCNPNTGVSKKEITVLEDWLINS